jgi:hypothetical protein
MSLSERAHRWRAERRRAILLETASASAALAVAVFGGVALLDRFAALPKGLRLSIFVAWFVAQAMLFLRRFWEPWRAFGWDAVFASAAARWPQTRPVLSSAWDLRGGPAAPGTSEELRGEHLARADRLAEELPAEPLYSRTPSRATRRWAVAAVVLLAANAVWGDATSWVRAFAPWRDAELERWVELEPGDARVDLGASVMIRARAKPGAEAAGVRPSALVLETRGSDGVWRPLEWTRSDDAVAERRVDSVSVALDYRVRWRDLAGRARRLEPVPPPRWTSAVAVVRDPRGERRYALGVDGAVRARRGDWIGLEAQADGPLASAAVRTPDRSAPVAMRLDGRVWKGGFPAQEEGDFVFDLVSADGRRDPSPPAYALSVAADAPPTAELLSPQVPLAASADESVTVTYALRDDSAVTRAALVVAAAGKPERSLALPVPSPARAEVVGDFSWPLAGLATGTKVRFWVEVWDDASPPQKGVSEKGEVTVVDAAADHAAALAARETADAAVEKAAAQAEAARDASRALDLNAASEKEAALGADWKAAQKALSDWADRAQADPRGDPGLAEEARRAADEFARAGEDGLPAAQKALARSDPRAAAREQDALASQARGVQQAMRDGARAPSEQDRARDMSEAGKTSEAMAAQAEEMAGRGSQGTVSEAELEKLQTALAEVEKQLEALRQAVKNMPEISPEQAQGKTSELPLDAARESAGELRRALQNGDVKGAAAAARKLAERLKTLSQTLDAAGRRAAESRGQRSSQAASKVRRAWQDAVDAQTKAVESARQVEDGRTQGLLARQREMLKDEAAAFDEKISSWAAAGLAPGARHALDDIAVRLKAGDAPGATERLHSTAVMLQLDAQGTPSRAARDHELSTALEAEAAGLTSGPSAPPADAAAARAAGQAQDAALARARALRGEVTGAAKDGYLSGRVTRRVDDAIGEEDAGSGALKRGDSGEGLKRAEAALSILQDGGKDADGADSAAGGAASSMGQGGGASGGAMMIRSAPRGSTGVRYERVRLPSADEYRPPRELREELERSLQESRPAAYDPAIKEYFKRLAR